MKNNKFLNSMELENVKSVNYLNKKKKFWVCGQRSNKLLLIKMFLMMFIILEFIFL